MSTFIRIIVSVLLLSGLSEQTQAAPPDVDGDGLVGPHEAIDLAQSWKGPALPVGGAQPWQIDGATIFYNTGKVGIGSATPHHQLRISGGPFWTSNLWSGSLELDNAAAIGWRENAGGQRFGIGQSTGGLYFFNTASDPGTTTSEAQYVMTITDDGAVHVPGSFGIGGDGSDQGARFQVNDGRIRIRESATLERWDLFYDPPSEKFYLQENAAYNHLVFTKGPDERVGMGTVDPAAKLHVLRSAGTAVLGESPNGNGVVGRNALSGNAATAGINSAQDGVGIFGQADLGASAVGIYGTSASGVGALGVSTINVGVKGTSNSNIGVQGVSTSSSGVEGRSGSSEGVYGYSDSSYGVRGYSANDTGVFGTTNGSDYEDAGVYAHSGNSANVPALRVEGFAIFSSSVRLRTLFVDGDIFLEGSIFETKSLSLIDHPVDPKNMYLSHSSVQSSELKTVYDGNVVTDEKGYVDVSLPDYFEALNIDFRYQLTVIDDADSANFVQAKIVRRIEGNQFTIRTSQPNVKVSWQVTGVRNDPYAKANPLEVETMKKPEEKGKYLSPELYGQPKEKGIHYRGGLERETAKVPKASKEEETK